MQITGARQNKHFTILEIDNTSAKQEGADLGKFLRKYFGIKEEKCK